ncbi:MAG: amidohydrolase [Chloroflexi bacterium]|nr:amidohydrolase [Chloroflexota bacterium]
MPAAPVKAISADSHVYEPPNTWVDNIDPKFKAIAPRMVRQGDHDILTTEGMEPRQVGAQAVAGKDPRDFKRSARHEDGRKGGWEPQARLVDMDTDGVEAEVLYPTLAFHMFRIPDLAYRIACLDAYNRWMAGLCSASPQRLWGLGLMTIHDAKVAVRQLHDIAKLGLKGACITAMAPEEKPFGDADYEPIWAAAEDAGIPLSLHVFTESSAKVESADFIVRYSVVPARIQQSLTTFISFGILEKFPKLKLVSVEVDIGWIPTYLQRIDHAFDRHRFWTGAGQRLKMKPSEYFHRQCFATFMEDRAGVLMRNEAGIKNILWSSDYPHADSTWPHSQEVIARQFAGVPDGDKRRIVRDNVRELYGVA